MRPSHGVGVFAKVTLEPHDVITFYDGIFKTTAGSDPEYVADCYDGYIHGIKKPIKGKGLGSLANCPSRNQKENAEFQPLIYKGRKTIVITATKTIKAGKEILVRYGTGYRLRKKPTHLIQHSPTIQ